MTLDFIQAVAAAHAGEKLEVLHCDPSGKPRWWERFSLRPDMPVVVWMLSATYRRAKIPPGVNVEDYAPARDLPVL